MSQIIDLWCQLIFWNFWPNISNFDDEHDKDDEDDTNDDEDDTDDDDQWASVRGSNQTTNGFFSSQPQALNHSYQPQPHCKCILYILCGIVYIVCILETVQEHERNQLHCK